MGNFPWQTVSHNQMVSQISPSKSKPNIWHSLARRLAWPPPVDQRKTARPWNPPGLSCRLSDDFFFLWELFSNTIGKTWKHMEKTWTNTYNDPKCRIQAPWNLIISSYGSWCWWIQGPIFRHHWWALGTTTVVFLWDFSYGYRPGGSKQHAPTCSSGSLDPGERSHVSWFPMACTCWGLLETNQFLQISSRSPQPQCKPRLFGGPTLLHHPYPIY